MNYKLKSLYYFIALVISVVLYYTLTYDTFNEFENTKSEVVDTELSEDTSEDQDRKAYVVE